MCTSSPLLTLLLPLFPIPYPITSPLPLPACPTPLLTLIGALKSDRVVARNDLRWLASHSSAPCH